MRASYGWNKPFVQFRLLYFLFWFQALYHTWEWSMECTYILVRSRTAVYPPSLPLLVFCAVLYWYSALTFDRFYSIIMPHKAASFNTVKRTNITVVCIAIVSVLYNLPHLFLSTIINWDCIPYATAMGQPYGEFYYLATVLVQFALPFVLISAMNSVIIHKIRHRFVLTEEPSRDRSIKDSNQRETKSSEKQVYAILLLVTFSFLILTTPWYLFFLFIMFVDFSQSPRLLAEYYLFYNIGQKMQYTNHGINFFLYVILGKKFRTDLRNVFPSSNKPKGNRESVVTTVEHLTDV